MKVTEDKVKSAIKELKQEHNWSWAREIDNRHKDDMSAKTIFYRGQQIDYRTFCQESDKMARSLKAMGCKKGDTISFCISNIPEFVMMLRAVSAIGAKAHIFGAEFDRDYIVDEIDELDSNYVVVSDDLYPEIEDVLSQTVVHNVIMFSLLDSLPYNDPYYFYDNFTNKVDEYKANDLRIMSKADFLEKGKDYQGEIFDDTVKLNDDFLITYTSGSTNAHRPKAMIHPNRNLIYMGRFHDPDLSGLPATRHIRNLAHIPTHSNTDIITSISDSLMQNCEIALEPIYRPEFFIYSLMINKPHFAPATKSFYIKMAKMYNTDPSFEGVKFKNTYIPTVVGEAMSPGEEKYINATLRKASAGTNMIPRPIAPVPVSFGGGDCEHGGIYFTLYKSYMERLNSAQLKNESIGLTPFNPLIKTIALDEEGNLLPPGEVGVLAASSPCMMKEYKNNFEATKKFLILDDDYELFGNLNVYGYYDKYNHAHIKGRKEEITLDNGTTFPIFIIKDLIEKDTKNILSAEVVIVGDHLVAHIEPMPDKKINLDKLIYSISKRLLNKIPYEVFNKILFKLRDNFISYPLTGCGKRDNAALVDEGITEDMIKPSIVDDELSIDYYYQGNHIKRVRK